MIEGLTNRIRSLQDSVARIALIPTLVRCGVFGSALLSFLLAYPTQILAGRVGGLLVVAAILPAVGPRRVWPTFAALVAVGGWVLSTSGYGEPVVRWRLLGLAIFLYLTHSLCALAALVPYDAVVDLGVIVRWLSRALAVALAAAVLGVSLLALPGQDGGDTFPAAAAVGGLLVAVAAAALLARLLRRR